MALRRGALEFGLRRLAETLRLLFDQRGIEQLSEMLAERMDFGPRGFAARGASGFLGGGHGREYGASRGAGEGRECAVRNWVEFEARRRNVPMTTKPEATR